MLFRKQPLTYPCGYAAVGGTAADIIRGPDGKAQLFRSAIFEAQLFRSAKGGIIRHADAGYEEAIEFAEKNDVKVPMRLVLPGHGFLPNDPCLTPMLL